ncbi:MAG: hypothetical protein ACSW8I_06715 [bacterium]
MTAIRKTLRLFSIAALIVAVAALTGCSKEEIGGDGLTFTTTVQMPAGGTKALDEHGEKTFAVGERIKVTCDDGSMTCTSEALTSADISADGKAAKFTFNFASAPTLSSGSTVTYEYPAAHSGLGGQDGRLATLQSTYDYASCSPTVSVTGQLPTNITLANQYAILKLNLKNSDGSVDITDGVRQLTVTLGGQTVTVNRTPAAGPVYVAVPAASGTIVFYAAKGKDLYTKSVSQTLTAGHLYPVNLSMSIVEGALSGLFSVSASKKVYFSKGNLMAVFIGSSDPIYTSPTWKFADNQWGCVGNAAANNAITGNGTVSTAGAVDLFGWSTTSTAYGIHNSTDAYDYRGDFRDWGTNAINNGGNAADLWCTLNDDEWRYIIYNHTWGMATVAGVCGLIILPDNYSGTPITSGYGNKWNTNSIDASSWASNYEAYGAVFLPAAGYRTGTTMFYDPSFNAENRRGYYWSSTPSGGYYMMFGQSGYGFERESNLCFQGRSVRLVRVAN